MFWIRLDANRSHRSPASTSKDKAVVWCIPACRSMPGNAHAFDQQAENLSGIVQSRVYAPQRALRRLVGFQERLGTFGGNETVARRFGPSQIAYTSFRSGGKSP